MGSYGYMYIYIFIVIYRNTYDMEYTSLTVRGCTSTAWLHGSRSSDELNQHGAAHENKKQMTMIMMIFGMF